MNKTENTNIQERASIPGGWETVPLLELGELIRGVTYKKQDASTEPFTESIPILRANNIQNGNLIQQELVYIPKNLVSEIQVITKGDILIATSSGSVSIVGKAARARNPMNTAFGAFCGLFRPRPEISSRYLGHYFGSQDYRQKVSAMARGVNINNLKRSHFESLRINLPPLNEQCRIADKLDTTLAAVEACKQKLNNAAETIRRFRQSVLAAAVSGELKRAWREERKTRIDQANNEIAELIEVRITNNGRRKAKLPVEPDTSNWSTELPETWALASVSMFAECLDSQRIPVKKEKRLTATGIYPYYGANGIVDKVDEYIFDDELVLVTEDETFYGRTKPIAYRSSGKCWVNNHAHVLRPQDKISANYLCYALMHYPVIPWLTGTTGRAKLTQAVLNALPIGVPPREEMEYIVNKVQILLHQADELDSRFKAALESLAQLQPSILAKAFRGELVPQDPSDEPASVLLQRIKDQREAEAAAKKPAKRGRKKKADPAQLVIQEGIADNHLSKVLEECGALSERALLAASELEPAVFQLQLSKELKADGLKQVDVDGEAAYEHAAWEGEG